LEIIWKGFAIDPKKSGAIESAKFILEVLKQHRSDLDHQTTKLGKNVAKIKKIDEHLERIQLIVDNISDLLRKTAC
jgi:hypothetical protein